MAELSKKLGKLSLAILENFVEKSLGEKFVKELGENKDKQTAIESALENSEARFVNEFKDKAFAAKMFTQINEADLGLLVDAIEKYYEYPAGLEFPTAIHRILESSFQETDAELLASASKEYVIMLTEAFALVDEKFRENVRALADLHGERKQQEMVDILRRVESLLSKQESQNMESVVLRSVYQLPQPPADFTGREVLITQLLNDFNSHKGATISGLTGMGGIGKTALGLVIADQLKNKYPDAQIFLDLKGTTTPLRVTDILRHVILSFEPTADLRALDEANMSAAYRSVLHGRKVLLFLDNARSAEQIAPLRPPETSAMLVTSRWAFTVPGLGSRRVDVMNADDAQKFLLDLCPRIKEHVAELARACAYLPLAIRIAGSFLRVNANWKVDKYLEELKSAKGRFETFAKSRAGADLTTEPDLLATFELSYIQLSNEEKRNWRALGVFPAPFDGTAAAAVWGMDEDEADNLLAVFMRYSLIDYNETAARYELHDLLAEYARSQMESGEEQEARIKHASHYKEVLSTADDLYLVGGEKILIGLWLFDIEWEHIRSAHAWIIENITQSERITELAMLYPGASVYCLDLRLAPKQKIEWLHIGVDAARKLENKKYEGIHLGNLGNAYAALGEPRKALEFYEQQLVIVREIGDRRGEGNALGNLGLAYADLGEPRKAIEFYEQALIIDREIGDHRGEGAALGNLGNAYYSLGDARKALEFYEQQLVIVREIGDRRGEGNALGNLGNAYAALGETRKAIEFYEQAVSIARETGNRRGEGNALFNMGLALYGLDEKDRATNMVHEALRIYEAIESPNAEKARSQLKEWGA